MKKLAIGFSIVLLGAFLVTNSAHASDWKKLEKNLNPNEKRVWIVMGDKESSGFVSEKMKKYRVSTQGFGGIHYMRAVEGFLQSGYPLITLFSRDQMHGKRKEALSLEQIPEKYRYLYVLPINEIEKILGEDKCVIAFRKVKISVARQLLDDEANWVAVSETDEESYITLIAAPKKRSLKKAIARFFSLEEIPLDPITFNPK